MGSQYLLKPLRTLRQACRDTRVAHPELPSEDCDACPHGKLCAISEQIEHGLHGVRREDENQILSQGRLRPPLACEVISGDVIWCRSEWQSHQD